MVARANKARAALAATVMQKHCRGRIAKKWLKAALALRREKETAAAAAVAATPPSRPPGSPAVSGSGSSPHLLSPTTRSGAAGAGFVAPASTPTAGPGKSGAGSGPAGMTTPTPTGKKTPAASGKGK